MALGVEAVAGGSATSSANITVSFTVTSATLLLVGVGIGNSGADPLNAITGVTYNGVSLTQVSGSASDDGNFEGVAWYRLNNPDTGTHNVVITHTASQAGCGVISFTGADFTLGTPSISTASTTNPSVTVVDSASGEIVVSGCASDNDTGTLDNNGTVIADHENVGSDSDFNFQYQTASGASTACTWTDSVGGQPWATSGLAVSPLASSREQEGFRWGVDDNNEASHGFEAAQDTDITILDDQSRLLRALVNATGDPASTAYALRVQKNGSGGYTAVPVGATVTTSPPTAPTATVTTISVAADPWTINRPAASTGDLIVFVIAWDDSTTVTSVTAPAGVNSETAVSIAGPIASNSTEMREQAWYYIATGAWSTGTLSFDPSASETARAVAFVIPAAQFNAADPIGFANTRASAGIAETSVLSPTGTAEGNDGSGRLYIAFSTDTDALTAPGSDWNTINNATGGGVGLLVGSRNTLVSNSESITALTATIAGDSWATLNFVVKPKVVNNEVYVVASANIAAGGEATTARLTAPAGKSTSDFVTGRRWDDENGTDSLDITADDYTEVEWLVYIASSAVNGDFYDFRVYAAAAALDTYSVTPRWTIGTSGGRTVNAATEALTLTRQNASIARSRALSAATEALSLTRHNATVARSRGVAAATEALALTAQPSSIGRARGVVAATEALVLVGLAATVTFQTTNDREVGATAELLTLTGQAASITTTRGVLASAQALTLTSFAATVRRGSVVTTVISRNRLSAKYVPSKSPLNTDQVLRSYVEREFQAVALAITAASPVVPTSNEELAAGVTIVDPLQEVGTFERYGNNETPGTTDMTSAFEAAGSVEGTVARPAWPFSTYLIGRVEIDSNARPEFDLRNAAITLSGDGAGIYFKGTMTRLRVWGGELTGDGVNRDADPDIDVQVAISVGNFTGDTIDDVLIDAPMIRNANVGIRIAYGVTPNRVVNRCVIRDPDISGSVGYNGGRGYGVQFTQAPGGHLIGGNIRGCGRHGAYLSEGEDYRISGTEVSGCGKNDGSIRGAVALSRSRNVVASNLFVHDNLDVGVIIDTDAQGISPQELRNVLVTGGLYENNKYGDFRIGSSADPATDGIGYNVAIKGALTVVPATQLTPSIVVNQVHGLSLDSCTFDATAHTAGNTKLVSFTALGGAQYTDSVTCKGNTFRGGSGTAYAFEIAADLCTGTETLRTSESDLIDIADLASLGAAITNPNIVLA